MSAARALRSTGRFLMVGGIVASLVGGWGLSLPSASATTDDSSVTVRWADAHPGATTPGAAALENLAVTVSQTRDLTSQGVRISWTGGTPTSLGEFATNYLQIMQCWGDDVAGPRPDQCQWGATSPSIATLLGLRAGSRDLVRNEDPAQVYNAAVRIPPPPDNPFQNAFRVPFQPVEGASTFTPADYFDANTSNEISAVRTGADGSGSIVFEVQTALEAPHLGCGAATASGPRGCWLVVVPRGAVNLDGRDAATATAAGRVTGSPLSATAWAQRIAIPLTFQSLAVSCPIGQDEERVAGAETIAAAIVRWQPVLCGKGVTLGFTQVGDGEARRLIVSGREGDSKLAFVTRPLNEEERADQVIRYAPAAQSALVVAYNIDYAVNSESPLASRNGTPVNDLVLNARLVAKLLTQSYRNDTPDGGVLGGITSNPVSIVKDPEFLRLNPDFRDFGINAFPPGMLVTLGGSDANALVWEWLQSDQSARGFLAGIPDESGMTINRAYLALELATTPTDSFPKADLSTLQQDGAPPPGFGTLDMRPYMNDYAEAALRALRGDANARIVWDPTRLPPSYVTTGAQRPGARFMIALVDAPSAVRYGLKTARLVNAAGQPIAPTADAITAMLAASPTDETTGTRSVDPGLVTAGVYPLAYPVYAAVNVCDLDAETRSSYSTVLSYATTTGQSPGSAAGELPAGFVPLAEADRTAAAAVIAGLGSASKECPTEEAPIEVVVDEPDVGFPVDELPPVDTEVAPPSFPEIDSTRALSPVPAGIGPVGFGAVLAVGVPSMLAGALLNRRARRLIESEEDFIQPAA
ncbi:MAG: hypothetical protein LDL15_00045 [Yonghaparkia sp.]|nr:hypothetical protein [Microcella sp.]